MAKTTARKARALEAYLEENLRDPEFRRHFEQRLARLRRPSQEAYLRHELLHAPGLADR